MRKEENRQRGSIGPGSFCMEMEKNSHINNSQSATVDDGIYTNDAVWPDPAYSLRNTILPTVTQ